MKSGLPALCAAAVAAAVLFAAPAGAQTTNRLKACNDEWNAMKANNTVGDKKYADFRKECLARLATPEAAPAPGATPAPGTAAAPPPAAQPPAARPPAGTHTATPTAPTAPATPPAAPAAPGQPVFPSAVSPKYSSETAGKARMHTCLDQYNENKATGGNADLKWIQKGGGYYSECNKKLKG